MVDRRPRLPLPTELSADEDPDGVRTSGVTPSLWTATGKPILTTPLEADAKVDTVVVGAGIAGLTTAYLLSKAGVKVLVLEDGAVGSGETGRTTAHFTNALDDRYHVIARKHGKANARLAAQSHTHAIETVARILEEERIRCSAERVDGYLFLHPTDDGKTLTKEEAACREAGLGVELVPSAPHFDSGPALRFPDQLWLHPLEYARGLVRAITELGGQVHTQSHARFPEGKVTANGHRVDFRKLVVCTNSPVNAEKGVSVRQAAFRTYVVAMEAKGKVPHAMWWDTGDHEAPTPFPPYHYVRLHRGSDGKDVLLSGGQDHLCGRLEHVEVDPHAALEEWTRERFPEAGRLLHKWSGEVFEPTDHLAFIGREPVGRDRFLASGDSGNGMTHGTLAGMILSDLARGRPNRFAKLYDPRRRPKGLATALRLHLGNAKTLAWKASPGDLASAADLAPGEGAVLGATNPKAAYRDDHGLLHACQAKCPHLGGTVAWNPAEKSFDCPLHGSRFTAYGAAICGPTNAGLEKATLDAKERGPERAASKRPPARAKPQPRKAVRARRA